MDRKWLIFFILCVILLFIWDAVVSMHIKGKSEANQNYRKKIAYQLMGVICYITYIRSYDQLSAFDFLTLCLFEIDTEKHL